MFNRLRERVRDWARDFISLHQVYQEVVNGKGRVVINRYNVFDLGPLHVRIHEIVASDNDDALHTHPWRNMTWVLDGGYVEVVPRRALTIGPHGRPFQPGDKFWTDAIPRGAGDFVFRGPSWAHRLVLLDDASPTLTLFIHWNWGEGRRWGMWSELDGSYRLVRYARP